LNHHLPTTMRRADGTKWGAEHVTRLASAAKPKGAMVFVHGFRGHPVETWHDFPGLLPLEAKAASYDLLFYGYDTRQQAPFSAAKLTTFLTALAQSPAVEVVNPSLAFGLPERPATFQYDHIVIAAHSLGAVVARLALLQAVDPNGDPLPWLSKVRLALFAPAHSGATVVALIALLMSGAPLKGQVEAVARRLFKSINDVETGSPTLKEMRKATRDLLRSHAQLASCHRAWVAHGEDDYIVSARQFVKDQPTTAIDKADHFEVCKPTAKKREPMDFLLGVLP